MSSEGGVRREILFTQVHFTPGSTAPNRKRLFAGTSLEVQWLKLHASNAGDTGLIPGWGTKIPYAMQRGQKENKTNNAKAPVCRLRVCVVLGHHFA